MPLRHFASGHPRRAGRGSDRIARSSSATGQREPVTQGQHLRQRPSNPCRLGHWARRHYRLAPGSDDALGAGRLRQLPPSSGAEVGGIGLAVPLQHGTGAVAGLAEGGPWPGQHLRCWRLRHGVRSAYCRRAAARGARYTGLWPLTISHLAAAGSQEMKPAMGALIRARVMRNGHRTG